MTATASQTHPLADDLRERRRAAGLTQADFARRAGVSLSSIRKIEQGVAPQGRSLVERVVRRTLDELE